MKKLLFVLLILPNIVWSQTVCHTDTLIINTGYDPVTGSAISFGANDSTPITDPYWKVTAISPAVVTAVAAMGFTLVTIGNYANVIGCPSCWVVNPAGHPGNWISCLNANGYYTPGVSDSAIYYMTLSREFKMWSDDSIVFSFYIADDNYISSTDIDGTIPLSFSQPATVSDSNSTAYHYFSKTVWLAGGKHTINVQEQNYDDDVYPDNAAGINIYGTLSSATGIKSLVSESVAGCDTSLLVDPVHLPVANIEVFPNPVASILTISPSDKITTIAITNLIGQTVYTHNYNSEQVQVDVADLPPGIYFVKVNSGSAGSSSGLTVTRKFVKE